jgi:hypothetical protein
MKQLAVCAVLSLVCICAHAQSKAFSKLAKIEGVEYIHIDKTMIELAAENGGNLQIGDNNILGNAPSEIVKLIDDVMVFHGEEEEVVAKLKKSAQKLLKGKKWQTLLDMNGEDGESVKICQAKEGDKYINVVLAGEDDDMQLVVINGALDFAELLKKQAGLN